MSQNTEPLWSCANYTAPLDYIIDGGIIEYDIAKANISVLYEKGVLTKDQYDRLYAAPKMEREVSIGYMIRRNSAISDTLRRGIEEARKSLFQILGLDLTNVLAIKNDAVYVIKNSIMDYPESISVSPLVTFKRKGNYRSYYRLKNKKLFYSCNPITGMDGLDIDGLGDYAIEKHSDYLLSWLLSIFHTAVTAGVKQALAQCNEFIALYIDRQLPVEFYRRLDSQAQFDFDRSISQWSYYRADFLTEGAEGMIDISYNLSILDSIAKIYINEIIKGSN